MAFDFPASPTVGATYSPSAGVVYTWNGYAWAFGTQSGASAAGFSTGDVKLTLKTGADVGWVMMNDGNIGDASSGATTRANADCVDLFTLLWNNISDTYCPVVGGRGATAAADWAAHKKLTLPRTLGRTLAGAGAGAGLTSRVLGQFLGEENHAWVGAELIQHGHTISDPTHYHNYQGYYLNAQASYVTHDGGSTYNVSLWGGYSTNTSAASVGVYDQNAGSSSSPNVMQPTTFINVMIKL